MLASIQLITRLKNTKYDQKAIGHHMLFEWTGDDFCLLKYLSKRSGRSNSVSRFILDFKNNYDEAVDLVVNLFISAIQGTEKELRDARHCRYIVSIPPSAASAPSVRCERVGKAVAGKFPWLTHLPEALVRTKTVRSSHLCPPEERPTYTDHMSTIEYRGPQITKDSNLIMLDDLLTAGATSSACRDILKKATSCAMVAGMYLGRTQ